VNRLSLRWRMTLYYAGVSVLILLVGGIVFLLALRSSLDRALDHGLRDAATLAATQLGGDEPAPGSLSREPDVRGLPDATTITVLDENGRVTERFGALQAEVPLAPGAQSKGGVRTFTLRLANGEWVRAARSEAETLEVFSQTLRLLALGLPILLLAGLGAGFLIADRALRPMDRVTTLAARIAEGGRYQERVPPVPGDDELARLTRTVNAMLATLEATIQRERAFALAAAHELRSPLTVLRGRAGLTLEDDLRPEQYRKAVAQMLEVSVELSGLVESLLTLAQSDAPASWQEVNLADAARDAAKAECANALARGVELRLELQSAPGRGDPASLRTIAANLISNAVRYGRSGGTVWVRTRLDDAHAVLEVADDGEGIPSAELERLQQPFQRGQAAQSLRGSGVGLALVKAIAEQHGGQLGLGRAEAGGLCARVTLPS
jgi:signal transduction histidine kinase